MNITIVISNVLKWKLRPGSNGTLAFDEAELCSDFLILDRKFKTKTTKTTFKLFIVRSFYIHYQKCKGKRVIQKVSVLIEEKFEVYQNQCIAFGALEDHYIGKSKYT